MTSLHWLGRWWLKEHAHPQGPVWFPLSPGQCTLYVEGYPPVCKMSFSWTWAAHRTGQGQLHAPQYWLFPPFLAFRDPDVSKRFMPVPWAEASRLRATSSASRCPWAPRGTAPGPPAAGCLCASVLQCVSLQQGEAFQESPPISVIRTPLFSSRTMQLYATRLLSSQPRSRQLDTGAAEV